MQHAQHHMASWGSKNQKSRLFFKIAPLWWNIGHLDPLVFWMLNICLSTQNNGLPGCSLSVPVKWLIFALKIQMTCLLFFLPWDLATDKVLWKKGYWVYPGLLLCYPVLEWFQSVHGGSSMSHHRGLFECSWVCTGAYSHVCQLQRYFLRGSCWATRHSLQLSSKHCELTCLLLSRDSCPPEKREALESSYHQCDITCASCFQSQAPSYTEPKLVWGCLTQIRTTEMASTCLVSFSPMDSHPWYCPFFKEYLVSGFV